MTCTYRSCRAPAEHPHRDESGALRANLCNLHDLALTYASARGTAAWLTVWIEACGGIEAKESFGTVVREPTGETL